MNAITIAISTMHGVLPPWLESIPDWLDVLIVNQGQQIREDSTQRIKVINDPGTGLSRSRNIAISSAMTDYILFCDNDNSYDMNLMCKLSYSIREEGTDLILFNTSNSSFRKLSPGSLKIREITCLASWQIGIRKDFIVKNRIQFNENFGLGSGKNSHGEENIFVMDVYRHQNAQVHKFHYDLVNHPDAGTGFIVDKNFYKTKLNIFKLMFPNLYILAFILFCIKFRIRRVI